MLPPVSDGDAIQRYWQRVGEVFDPKRPVPVDEPELFAQRKAEYDQVQKLERVLRRPFDDQKYLVAGTVGNGKTSSLSRLASNLAEHRMVVLFDAWRHFERQVKEPRALDRLEPWELAGLLGLAIIRAGESRFGHSWGRETDRLQDALGRLRASDNSGGEAEIDVVKLARGLAVAAGGLAGAAGGPAGAALGAGAAKGAADVALQVLDVASDATSWSWRLGLGAKRRADQDQDVRDLVKAINELVHELERVYGRRLVLVVDGIDRVQDPERLLVLFVQSSLLGEIDCDQVFTVPTAVFDSTAHQAVAYESRELSNIAVLDPDDPTRAGGDVEFFRSLTRRRLDSISRAWAKRGEAVPCPDPIPSAVVDELAHYSGGVVREFMQMVVYGASEAWEARTTAFDASLVEEVLRHARSLKESRITKGEVEMLEGVMSDPRHELPDGEMARELLREKRLLPYPNERTWYYPHPLLTRVVLRPGARSVS